MQLWFYQDPRHSWGMMNSRVWFYYKIWNSERNWVQKYHCVILPDCPACPFCNCCGSPDGGGGLAWHPWPLCKKKNLTKLSALYSVHYHARARQQHFKSNMKKMQKNKTVAVLCRFVWLNSISECATANQLELTRQIELFSMVELKKIQTIKRLFFLKSTILWNFHVGNEWF